MKKLLIILLILGIHGPAYASAERNFYCTREGNISIIHYFKFDKDYFYWIYGEKSYSDGKKYWNNRTKASITSHNLIANGDDMETLEWFEFIDFGKIVWKKPKGKYLKPSLIFNWLNELLDVTAVKFPSSFSKVPKLFP